MTIAIWILGGLLALAVLIIILQSLMLGAQPECFLIRIATRETEIEQFKATCSCGEFESGWNMSLRATKSAAFDHLRATGAIAVEFEVSE